MEGIGHDSLSHSASKIWPSIQFFLCLHSPFPVNTSIFPVFLLNIFHANPFSGKGTNRRRLVWTELCSPIPNSYIEVITSNVIVFGDGAFMEVTKDKQRHEGRPWPCRIADVIRERHWTSVSGCAQKRGHLRTSWEDGHLQVEERGLKRNQCC